MRINAMPAVLCLSAGVACLAAAASSNLAAVDCEPELWSPARCIPAHADMPVQTGGGAWCEFNMSYECVPKPQSLCVDSYATAVAGACEPFVDYSNPTQCTLDYGVTFVEVHRYLAACETVQGGCLCKFTRDTTVNPQLIEVCQCSESEI
jgi:hypothetical protein